MALYVSDAVTVITREGFTLVKGLRVLSVEECVACGLRRLRRLLLGEGVMLGTRAQLFVHLQRFSSFSASLLRLQCQGMRME